MTWQFHGSAYQFAAKGQIGITFWRDHDFIGNHLKRPTTLNIAAHAEFVGLPPQRRRICNSLFTPGTIYSVLELFI